MPKQLSGKPRPVWVNLVALLCLVPSCRRRQQATPIGESKSKRGVQILYPTAPASFAKLSGRVAPSVVHLFADSPRDDGPAAALGADLQHPTLAGSNWALARQRALGSGFLLNDEGEILTAASVVVDIETIGVTLHDGRSATARLVGHDQHLDVALLRLQPTLKSLPAPLPLFRSSGLRSGQWVMCLSNPVGLGERALPTVVAAPARQAVPMAMRNPWSHVQLAARLSRLEAGAPLVTSQGAAAGLCLAPHSRDLPTGLAVPIGTIKRILPLMRREGAVVRAWVGMYVDRITAKIARDKGLPGTMGALVTGVIASGPAARAGLLPGDVVLRFDGQKIEQAETLPALATATGVGKAVQMIVWRNQKRHSVVLQTEALPQ